MSGEVPYLGADEQRILREKFGYPCRDALRAAVRGADLTTEPGAEVKYSCLNAILVGEIVEQVSGMPLDAFAAEQIFKPLGMRDTAFNPDAALAIRCVPTTKSARDGGPDGFLRGRVHDPLAALGAGVAGNAGLFSTADDLATFAEMLLGGGERSGTRILKSETVALSTNPLNAPADDRRGLLWDIYPPKPAEGGVEAIHAYGHTGYTGTAMRIYPEQGYYVVALTNRVHPDDSGKVAEFRNAIWRTVSEALLGAK
jgi:CubicO group peptidase (beta-lactamase class C family)